MIITVAVAIIIKTVVHCLIVNTLFYLWLFYYISCISKQSYILHFPVLFFGFALALKANLGHALNTVGIFSNISAPFGSLAAIYIINIGGFVIAI